MAQPSTPGGPRAHLFGAADDSPDPGQVTGERAVGEPAAGRPTPTAPTSPPPTSDGALPDRDRPDRPPAGRPARDGTPAEDHAPRGEPAREEEGEPARQEEAVRAWRRVGWAVVPGLVFVAVTLALVGPALARGSPLAATDLLLRTAPFRAAQPAPVTVGNPLQGDQAVQLPFVVEFWAAARSGHLQLWEPDVGAGIPLFATSYTRVAAVWFAPMLLIDAATAVTLATAAGMLVAQLALYGLGRRLGLGRIGATFAAVSYVASGPVLTAVLRIHEVFLLPVVLYAVHAAVTDDRTRIADTPARTPAQTASAGTPRAPTNGCRGRFLVLTSLAVAATWTAGFPAGGLYVSYTALAFGVWLLVSTTAGGRGRARFVAAVRTAWRPVVAAAAGLGIAAVQLLPTAQFLGATTALQRRLPPDHAAGVYQLADAVSGRFFGTFQHRTWWLDDPSIANPFEASATMGLVTLGLLGLVAGGLRGHRRADTAIGRFFLPVALIVLLGSYLGEPVLRVLYLLPGMAVNAFNRARFVAALGIALTAGLGVDRLVSSLSWRAPTTNTARRPRQQKTVPHRLSRRGRPPPAVRLQAAAVIGLVAVGLAAGLRRAVARGALEHVAPALAVPLVVATAAAAVVAGLRRRGVPPGRARPWRWAIGLVLTGAVAVELLWGGWGFTPVSPPSSFYPPFAVPERLAATTGPGGHLRLFGRGLDVLPPHSAALYDLSDLRIQYPTTARYQQLLETADPGLVHTAPAQAIVKTAFTDKLRLDSPVLDALSAGWLVAPLDERPRELGGDRRVALPGRRQLPMRFSVPVPPGGLRALSLPLARAESGCARGWVTVRVATESGHHTVHRPVRDLEGAGTFFVLPDIRPRARTVGVQAAADRCPVRLRGRTAVVNPPAADSVLDTVAVDNWVVYRRSGARPRVELARAVRRIDDPARRLRFLAGRPADGPVVVEHGPAQRRLAGGRARLLTDRPDRVVVRVESRGAGLLVLRDGFAPGWHARVDGRSVPIHPVDHALRGIEVPAGTHTVVFRYLPDTLVWGAGLAAGGLVATVLLGVGPQLVAWLVSRGGSRLSGRRRDGHVG